MIEVISSVFMFTVKLVYKHDKNHPRDQQNVVLMHRWSVHVYMQIQ